MDKPILPDGFRLPTPDQLMADPPPSAFVTMPASPAAPSLHTILKKIQDEKAKVDQEKTAEAFFIRIAARIREFEEALDPNSEVGVRLVNFGEALRFSVSDIGFMNPLLIVFKGHTDGGEEIELVQHVSQISFALIKVPRQETSEPRQPIGFLYT